MTDNVKAMLQNIQRLRTADNVSPAVKELHKLQALQMLRHDAALTRIDGPRRRRGRRSGPYEVPPGNRHQLPPNISALAPNLAHLGPNVLAPLLEEAKRRFFGGFFARQLCQDDPDDDQSKDGIEKAQDFDEKEEINLSEAGGNGGGIDSILDEDEIILEEDVGVDDEDGEISVQKPPREIVKKTHKQSRLQSRVTRAAIVPAVCHRTWISRSSLRAFKCLQHSRF